MEDRIIILCWLINQVNLSLFKTVKNLDERIDTAIKNNDMATLYKLREFALGIDAYADVIIGMTDAMRYISNSVNKEGE